MKSKKKVMKVNMGIADRLIRVLLAAALTLLFVLKIVTGVVAIIGLVVAGIFLITSFLGNCPLYSVFRINSCGKNRRIGA